MGELLGIYKITCRNNNKFYIGSSINIDKRLKEHINLLRKNKHKNKYLQKSWNKYGEANFKYEIIETIYNINDLRIREKWWINNTNCYNKATGFNIATSTHFPVRKFIDLTGQIFNKLKVLKYIGKTKRGISKWNCLCICGKQIITTSSNLKNGNTKSCGCLRKEIVSKRSLKHGYSFKNKISRIYRTYHGMLQRCNNINNPKYRYYGGKDKPITVCKRWSGKNGFIKFLKDMGEPPTDKHQIGRLNKRLGYYKKNCKWVLSKNNNRNKQNNIMVPFNEKYMCLKDYCKEKKLNYITILNRINKLAWSIKKALTTPIRERK